MIKAKKILFVTQEMTPYVSESTLASLGRKVPQATQEDKREIRTFMPKWGHINERRNQLHEVIRLSGMNLVVDDTDHTLVIKVASIPSARMQVYFIDNDDFFTKRKMARDDKGAEYKDNAERAAFFARGVLETVKKLRWAPDVIHCQGWMASFIPVYLKEAYCEEPSFRDCRIVFTPADEELKAPLPDNINGILGFNGISASKALEGTDGTRDMQTLNRLGMKFADGIMALSTDTPLVEYAKQTGKPLLTAERPEDFCATAPAFFDQIWSAGKDEIPEENED
ncbi:MAG TPA: glycogen synthase [Prevotellaceae bacterium]|nr:glycogen synthase [Prevotellaceae bacterium]